MKWQYFILLLSLLSACKGEEEFKTKLSIKYFTHKNIKFVCVMSCGNPYFTQRFTKQLNKNFIATGIVDINRQYLDYGKIKRCLSQDYTAIGVFVDYKCNNTEKIILYASESMSFVSERQWLIFDQRNTANITQTIKRSEIDLDWLQDNNETVSPLTSLLSSLNLSVNSDITVALQQEFGHINLMEVFNYGKLQGGKLTIKNLGQWNLMKAQDLNNLNAYKFYRRWDFKELILRMVVVMSQKQKNINRKVINEEQRLSELSVITQTSLMTLNVVAEIHNFKYRYSIVDRWIGNYKRNGTVTVTNSLYFKEQDISPIIRLSKSTCDHVDVINPPMTSIETRYYYKIPTHGPGKFENQFLRPLSTGAWLSVLAVSVLCAIVLVLSSLFERRPASAQFAVFSVLASICQQCNVKYDDVVCEKEEEDTIEVVLLNKFNVFEDNGEMALRRTTTAGKMTILVTGASCVLIYNYYTSSVVSWLLNGPPPSINSLRELLESPLELIFEDIGYTRSWLQMPDYYYNKRNAKVEDELRQKKVFNKKKGAPLLVPLEKGIEMVKAGGYAYHTEVDSANTIISRTFTQKELCELGSLQSMEETLLYVCLQKNSPYREFFTWSLLRLLERGIVSCIQDRIRAPEVSCEGSSPRALALGGAAPAFIMLGVGYVLAFAVMAMERIYNKVQRRMQNSYHYYLRKSNL